MKTLFKTLALGALVATSFTACHTGEGAEKVVVDNVVISPRVLVIHANTNATFNMGGVTKNGTEVTFETNAYNSSCIE